MIVKTKPASLWGYPKWIWALGLTFVYILSGFFCILHLSVPPDNYSLLWLPSGIGLIMFLLLDYKALWGILLGSFIINTYYSFLNQHFFDSSKTVLFGLLFASADVLEAFIAWKMVKYLEKELNLPFLTRNQHLIPFLIFVCVFPSLMTAFILVGMEMLRSNQVFSPAHIFKLTSYFTVGNSIGILLIGPIYWAIKIYPKEAFDTKAKQNGAIYTIVIISLTILLSFVKIPSIIFITIPMLAILAKYGNLVFSIIGAFAVCLFLSVGTGYNLGFFAEHLDKDTSFETVLFLLSLVFVLYFSTIAFSELNLHRNKLQLLVEESVSTMEISEQRYRMLAENVLDVIWVLNIPAMRFTYISPSIFQLRGYTVEEALNHTPEDSLTPDSMQRVKERLTMAIKEIEANPNEKKYYYDEFQQYRRDGTPIWIETVTHLIKNKFDEYEAVGVSRNIADRKASEAQLKANQERLDQLNATKDKFFSIIAHDLMSPFNTLIGFSSLLSKQSAKNDMEGVAKSAKFMHDAAEKTRDLLKNLLEWSQTQTGSVQFNPELIDIRNCVTEVSDLLHATAEQKGIELSMAIEQEGQVFADKYMLSTVLRNLVSNAIKYTYPGGFIQILVHQDEQNWQFQVKDNGTGMESEQLKQIFQLGAHKSEAGTQKEQGTGLGLILCKEFIEKHEGRIWVNSKPGAGTIFGFNIPVR